MACVGLISLIRTVELNFLEPRPSLVVDYKDEIQSLRQRLYDLLALLEESEKKLNVSQAERDVIARVKDISLRAEDDIETEVMEILSNGASHETLHQILQRLAQDTEGLIDQCIIEQRNTTTTDEMSSSSYNPQSNQDHITPASGASKMDDAMVGHGEELERTKDMLLQRSTQERQVISIVGMGGIGKTTMAKNIYDDPSIRSHFDVLGWATVSQHYDLRRILHDLCRCVVQMTDKEISEVKNSAQLANKVRQRLMGQRYIIVVDDIWGSRGWDDLQRCFPDDSNGSRILLTTRLKEVADYSGSSGKYVCNLPFLNSNESWKLFSQKLGSIILPPEIEAIGKRIVNKCRGLPLAITVAAGLLSKTQKSVENWQSIASAMNLPMTSDLHDQCSTILTLSYNNLPYHLKACFLYFGVFPRVRREIPTKDLLKLWIAEGFVREDSGSSLEEGAMEYLQDLIDRNLVLSSKLSFIGNIKTCRMHDLLFDLCLREVEKEKFVSAFRQRSVVELGDTEPLFEYANRWLTFQTRNIRPKFNDNYNFHKSRTLVFFFGASGDSGMPVSWRQNMSFKMIRVLDLRAIRLEEAPNFDISDLILLRYLALSTIKYVRVLKHHHSLQTLIVKLTNPYLIEDFESEEEIGSKWLQCLWKSQNLRFIEYPYPFPIDDTDDEVPVQHSLHTLYWVPYLRCTKEFVLKIPNVKVLGIRCEETCSTQTESWWDNLHYLTKLEKLIVEDFESEPFELQNINSFPRSLKELKIVGTQLGWETITVISMLPNLESLKLLQAYNMGEDWKTEEGGFPKLKYLVISAAKLNNWESMGDHFPVLERLALHHCHDLEMIPEDFASITTLQLIELKDCCRSLVDSAKGIQEEQSTYGIDHLVVRDYETRS